MCAIALLIGSLAVIDGFTGAGFFRVAFDRPVLPLGISLLAGWSYSCVSTGLFKLDARGSGIWAQPLALWVVASTTIGVATVALVETLTSASSPLGVTNLGADDGWVASSPLVVGDRIFVGTAQKSARGKSFGAVHCLDGLSMRELWVFSDGGKMKQLLSSPCFADNRIFVGEGFHEDLGCKTYCLDSATGAKIWEFATTSHTESTPSVVGDKIYFGAGADGLYCLNARNGQILWHFEGPHVDGSPAVDGPRVFAGSGYGRLEVFCLDANTGTPIWQVPLQLASFGLPSCVGGQVLFGIGNGNLVASAEASSGALLCLDGQTGKCIWRHDVPDAVHSKPLVVGDTVFFTCRDGHCYCVNRADGRLRWTRNVGSPIVTAPTLVRGTRLRNDPSVCVVASDAFVCFLDPTTGLPYSIRRPPHNGTRPIVSSPAVIIAHQRGESFPRIGFGGSLGNLACRPALFYFD